MAQIIWLSISGGVMIADTMKIIRMAYFLTLFKYAELTMSAFAKKYITSGN